MGAIFIFLPARFPKGLFLFFYVCCVRVVCCFEFLKNDTVLWPRSKLEGQTENGPSGPPIHPANLKMDLLILQVGVH